ncbi:basic blue protein [Amaranthus tricolor]|uniref:basic blue protein n=1 Tax=Amaranthus tricolor TaxID=29722 RepID=UPI00258BBA3E|nr:basic blue protein [Amaranthus tricolor]
MEVSKRRLLAMVVVLMVCNIKEGSATKHIVGGSDGWDESTDYDSWAKTQTFAVGDTLVFKYTPGLHNVAELGSENEYKSCDTSNAANSMSTGNDVVKLDKVGTRYFACGTSGHCSAGMKLKVNVVAADKQSSSSSPTSDSSSSSSSSSPTSSSSTFGVLSGLYFFPLIVSAVLPMFGL